jgi:hypothetical protein
MRSIARISAVLGSLCTAACVGTVGGSVAGAPDAAPSANPDAPPEQVALKVSGVTTDYFGGIALPATAYATDGMTPAISGTSGPDGSYTLIGVPPASSFYVSITAGDLFRPTRNDAIVVKDVSLTTNVYAVSKVDTQRQYSTLGKAPTAGTAALIAELRKNDGTPLTGVAIADVSLVDAAGKPAPGAIGPFFFGKDGDVVDNNVLVQSIDVNGKARVAFLDVPPGAWMLQVNYNNDAVPPVAKTMLVPATTIADGVTLVSTGHGDATGTGTGGGGQALTFTADVYPLLQRAAQGGQGCANCHNAITLAGGLAYDGAAADVYTKVMAAPGVVVVATPATSKLLTMPLYEVPPDTHPNATWLTTADPAYLKILDWITAGAKL